MCKHCLPVSATQLGLPSVLGCLGGPVKSAKTSLASLSHLGVSRSEEVHKTASFSAHAVHTSMS